MFGGFAPPQASPEELRAAEVEANGNIKLAVATAAFLYISPFIVDAVWKIF
ncbi:mitochondrial outer membrane translocase complex, subunit Tom5 [Cladorrhinum samala]|uniref:Mitochondrial outer membrane translocase complex, subunit Tom5 n=1 Tax=Cladorrhinum samala TaxID=585594 RepID=A0AAV9HN98_9PEZI|nr:mitochondrial outer membrane translocase complex, subunit Tom5 [Cladorrhinum samala]